MPIQGQRMMQQQQMTNIQQYERAAGQSMHIKKPSMQKMNPNNIPGMYVPQQASRTTMSRTNLNMTYSEVPLNQSQMVYQDFTDGQMLQDEFYGRNQAHEDVDFLDEGEDDGIFTELNAGNGRLQASSTMSYIPATERN